jgi:predicted phosphodiesterase
MGRIAGISDLHGNTPALEAVFEDIDRRGICRIMCLGDLAGKGPDSPRAVDMVRGRCESAVTGNWDFSIANPRPTEPAWLRFDWYRAQLGEDRLAYMRSLPVYLEFYMSGRFVRLCHASPHDLWHRTFLATDTEERLRLFAPIGTTGKTADVIGYGDIHWAYVDSFEGKMMFNTGSVGNPLEITQASYAIMEGDYGSEALSPFSVAIVRVPYDIEKAVAEALASDMPFIEEYVNELRTAEYRGKPAKK